MMLFEIFNAFSFYSLLLSKKFDIVTRREILIEKNNTTLFVTNINKLYDTIKTLITTIIKIIIPLSKNIVSINGIVRTWMKISSYIQLGVFEKFFTCFLLKSFFWVFRFINKKIKVYIQLKLNNNVAVYLLKSFDILKTKKKQFIKAIKKKLFDMTIFNIYIKIHVIMEEYNLFNVEISLKIQFYFLINFFFLNIKVLK